MNSYKTHGTCSREIKFEIKDNIIEEIQFVGGCMGNTTGVATLAKGRPIDEVIELLRGIDCGGRGTSCPDQLAIALSAYKDKHAKQKNTHDKKAYEKEVHEKEISISEHNDADTANESQEA